MIKNTPEALGPSYYPKRYSIEERGYRLTVKCFSVTRSFRLGFHQPGTPRGKVELVTPHGFRVAVGRRFVSEKTYSVVEN